LKEEKRRERSKKEGDQRGHCKIISSEYKKKMKKMKE